MPIPKIALSQVGLELEEALYLKERLQRGVYEQHIAFQLGNIVQKLQVKITIELEGMELIVLNTVLNDLIVATPTNNEAALRLAEVQRKVQEQVVRRYQEILAAQ